MKASNQQYSELNTSEQRIKFRKEILEEKNKYERERIFKSQSQASANRLNQSLESIISNPSIDEVTKEEFKRLKNELAIAQDKKKQDMPVDYDSLVKGTSIPCRVGQREGEPYFSFHFPKILYMTICTELDKNIYSDEETKLWASDFSSILLKKADISGNETVIGQRIENAVLANKKALLANLKTHVESSKSRCISDEIRQQNRRLQHLSSSSDALIVKIEALASNPLATANDIVELSNEGERFATKVSDEVRRFKKLSGNAPIKEDSPIKTQQKSANTLKEVEQSFDSIISNPAINEDTKGRFERLRNKLSKAQDIKSQNDLVNYGLLVKSTNISCRVGLRDSEPYFSFHFPKILYHTICAELDKNIYSDENTQFWARDFTSVLLKKADIAGNEVAIGQRIKKAVLANKERLLADIKNHVDLSKSRCISDESRQQNPELQRLSRSSDALIAKIEALASNPLATANDIVELSQDQEKYSASVSDEVKKFKSNQPPQPLRKKEESPLVAKAFPPAVPKSSSEALITSPFDVISEELSSQRDTKKQSPVDYFQYTYRKGSSGFSMLSIGNDGVALDSLRVKDGKVQKYNEGFKDIDLTPECAKSIEDNQKILEATQALCETVNDKFFQNSWRDIANVSVNRTGEVSIHFYEPKNLEEKKPVKYWIEEIIANNPNLAVRVNDGRLIFPKGSPEEIIQHIANFTSKVQTPKKSPGSEKPQQMKQVFKETKSSFHSQHSTDLSVTASEDEGEKIKRIPEEKINELNAIFDSKPKKEINAKVKRFLQYDVIYPDKNSSEVVLVDGTVKLSRSSKIPESQDNIEYLADKMVKAYIVSQGGTVLETEVKLPDNFAPPVISGSNEKMNQALAQRFEQLNIPLEVEKNTTRP